MSHDFSSRVLIVLMMGSGMGMRRDFTSEAANATHGKPTIPEESCRHAEAPLSLDCAVGTRTYAVPVLARCQRRNSQEPRSAWLDTRGPQTGCAHTNLVGRRPENFADF